MVPADSRRISPVSRYSGYYYFIKTYYYRTITFYDLTFQIICINFYKDIVVLQPQICLNIFGLGFSPFARHYLGNHSIIFFSTAYLDVSVQRVGQFRPDKSGGFSHSEIFGLTVFWHLPEAYRSLTRPSSPSRA